jgi:peptide chain release factor 1
MNEPFWSRVERRAEEISAKLASPAVDSQERHLLQKEMSFLSTLIAAHTEHERLAHEQHALLEQSAADPELKELYEEELAEVSRALARQDQQLDALLFPGDPLDDRAVFLEIRAGAGGQEAALFVGDLLRMYTLYAECMGWKSSLTSVSETDLGGYREVVLHIEGKGVYGHLKFESGVHRVQRVPSTEASGRIHTSTATVAVLPEAEEVEFSINSQDLRIDVYRSGGAGGQHVNTTDSAVRITHIPTGLVVTCQDERSQHKNKAKALKVLKSRLVVAQKEKTDSEQSQKRREQVGSGERAEKVRTYNFPQNRITDHQVELTLKKLDRVLEGDLGEIVDALREQERSRRRSEGSLMSRFI